MNNHALSRISGRSRSRYVNRTAATRSPAIWNHLRSGRETLDTLSFGSLEPLVCLMQETPVNRLLPTLVEQLRSGMDLRR